MLFVATATPGRWGNNCETGQHVPIQYFAIAQYPNSRDDPYLFGVSAELQVVKDTTLHESELAMEEMCREGVLKHSRWHRIPGASDQSDGFLPRAPETPSHAVLCEGCGAKLKVPDLSTVDYAHLARVTREQGPFMALVQLGKRWHMGLAESKILSEHISRTKGVCHKCQGPLVGSGEVVCQNCKSINLDW